MEASVGEVECRIDLLKRKTIVGSGKKCGTRESELVRGAIKKVQNHLKVDIFGFGDAIHRADPAAWKILKEDWDKRFTHLDVNVQADVKIRRIGTVTNSFFQKRGEVKAMWAITAIVVTASLMVILEVPPLLKAKLKRELWLFSILLLLGTLLSIAKYLQIPIPNPLDMLYVIFKPMSDLLISFLK